MKPVPRVETAKVLPVVLRVDVAEEILGRLARLLSVAEELHSAAEEEEVHSAVDPNSALFFMLGRIHFCPALHSGWNVSKLNPVIWVEWGFIFFLRLDQVCLLHGFYIWWFLISRCARMMKTRSFSEKKIGFDDSFDVTKCIRQIEMPDLVHVCA